MTYLKQSLEHIPCALEMLVKKSLSLTHSNYSIIAVWTAGLGRADSQTSQMETAQRTLGWCPTVKENKLFFLSLLPLSPQLDELTKIKPGKYLGLFPGARSGGWFRETGRSAGKSKALQCQVALPSWCCCRSPHRCRAELCSPGLRLSSLSIFSCPLCMLPPC